MKVTEVQQSHYMADFRFQPRNLLQFQTWGIFRDGVDSCNLQCSCNLVMFMEFSYYFYERECHSLVIVHKLCALISTLQ